MKLKYLILYVEDVQATSDFYERAFGFAKRMESEYGGYIELDTGETVLSFLSHGSVKEMGKTSATPDSQRPSFEIALEVENVPEMLDKAIKAGAKLVQEPTDMPWGQTISYVTDMNGFLVEICTPVAS